MELNEHSDLNKEALFSVVILHYNQEKFINQALDSVFQQNYGNIELIIADDATYGLDIGKIKSYIEEHRTPQISNVMYQINENNLGTIKNVNNALASASGKYALFFAADDSLFDSLVLTNFANILNILPPDKYMVCGQCAMMDEKLEEKLGDFVNVPLALDMNKASSFEQFKTIAFSCFYAMGATAFRMDMLKEKGSFDETYKIIEDWSYYLSLTISGSKIIYSDFYALKHRDGGVSHFNKEVLPPHVIEYKNDSLLIQEKLVLPHLSRFLLTEQVKLLDRYDRERASFACLFTNKERPSRISIILKHKRLYLRKAVWSFMDRVYFLRDRCLHWAKFFFPVWATLYFLKIIAALFSPDKQFFFVNTQAYDIITFVVFILLAIDLVLLIAIVLFYGVVSLRRITKNFFSSKR